MVLVFLARRAPDARGSKLTQGLAHTYQRVARVDAPTWTVPLGRYVVELAESGQAGGEVAVRKGNGCE